MIPLIAIALGVIGGLPAPQGATTTGSATVAANVAVGMPAPDFALRDAVTGKTRHLAEFAQAKRPVALFFFCGCSWCAAVAKEWASYERGGLVPTGAATVIVCDADDAAEAREMVSSTGLSLGKNLVLVDTTGSTMFQSYHADICPRVFIVDRQGKIRYSNTAPDELPRQAAANVITLRAVTALGNVSLAHSR